LRRLYSPSRCDDLRGQYLDYGIYQEEINASKQVRN